MNIHDTLEAAKGRLDAALADLDIPAPPTRLPRRSAGSGAWKGLGVAAAIGVMGLVVGMLVWQPGPLGPVATQPTETTAVTTPEPTSPATTDPTTTTTGVSPDPGTSLIVWPFGALGWWDGSRWVQVDGATPGLPIVGGETYRVVGLGTDLGTVTGGEETLMCEPLLNQGVVLDDPARLAVGPRHHGVAVLGDWDLAPRSIASGPAVGELAGIARALLASEGLGIAEATVVESFSVDLDGDGTDEVLVVAEAIGDPALFAAPGDYSIAFVRWGADSTTVLGVSIAEDEAGVSPYVQSFRIGGVGDLNGDGTMEVVLSSAYYEGSGVEVYAFADPLLVRDDVPGSGLVAVLSSGCGV